ncbi:hypothetical protein FNW52_01850 [Flavobacterium sp. ZT3R18]|uniref:hypothetical protein n=1 Tax=Flavobacterium sp. ZT3R18 TaxID=2594429 RepID=UPI0011798B89|nr:hypothetical protein [Flavobacterium sp. ZT3R18]TRX38812.1 hypothetical protein FNW52_01850 [Flavobacterium sp. ZT3R18]
MKTIKLIYTVTFAILCTSLSYSQVEAHTIISGKTTIAKFYLQRELESMKKGQLIDLYVERSNALTCSLHLIGLASNPNVTMKDLGIVENSDIIKQLDIKHTEEVNFITKMSNFEKTFLPYVDKIELVSSILFYEDILKKLQGKD